MSSSSRPAIQPAGIRPPAVSGSFYPASPGRLIGLVSALLDEADALADAPADVPADAEEDAADAAPRTVGPSHGPVPGSLLGILVPHAGLAYSGIVAAAGWRLLRRAPGDGPTTIVILGTNHGAGWLTGVGAWEAGAWRTPLGDVEVDGGLARSIVGLGFPFVEDRPAHVDEHSIEVQLPLLQAVGPTCRIVPLAVAAGTGDRAIEAGERLGTLLADELVAGRRVVLAISSDMAHYPDAAACSSVTDALLPSIVGLDPVGLARRERSLMEEGVRGLVCGMCGIDPTVLGLGALRAMGATRGLALASATSADAGGAPDRAVGYLSVAFSGA